MEFALCAPLVFLLFFAAIEYSRMNMVRHTMDLAAYEGARAGIVAGATSAEVRDRVTNILSTVAVRQATINVTPATIDRTTREILVDVEVPIAANSWLLPNHLAGLRLKTNSRMAREGSTGGS